MNIEPSELGKMLEKNGNNGKNGKNGSLMSVLEEIQSRYRYLPQEALVLVSESMGLPLSQVYSVATFYNAFSLERRGRHELCVCVGTACHVRGAKQVLSRLEEKLGIEPGQTTPDWNYTLETAHCLGACALGPIVVVDGEYSGQMDTRKADNLLQITEMADIAEA
ncbi:MAG: NAD(P)H-dependent oxidoreductase subunit E [Anaerolineales bacterium]|nr:NAD(P)H-dependent oxidoreductase subunit E [Anaerolineales bacterium]